MGPLSVVYIEIVHISESPLVPKVPLHVLYAITERVNAIVANLS